MNSDSLLRAIALSALFTILFVPLVVVNGFFFPFITGKAFLFRVLVEVAFAAYVVLALRNPQYRPKNSYILMSLAAFLVVMAVATLLSENPIKSFWSNYERMEGYVTLLHLGAYFIALASLLNTEKLWRQFLSTSVGVSALIGVYGLLQLAGVFVINQGGVRLDATLGNAAYLAVYMLLHIGITAFLLLRTRNGGAARYFYWAALLLQIIAVYFTATRGALLGLGVGMLVAAVMVAVQGKAYPMLRKVAIGGLLALVLFVGGLWAFKDAAFIQESQTLSRLASISLSEGNTRFAIWDIAFKGFQERPLFGWGQESFNYVFNKYYEPGLYAQESWFDRAHNVFLDWLIAGGLLGLLGYLALYASLCILVIRIEEFTLPQKAVFIGLLVAYFVNNIFVFDNLASYLIFFAILAYVHGRNARPLEWRIPTPQEQQAITRIALPVVAVLLAGTLYIVNVPSMLAAHDLLLALSPHQAGLNENLTYFKHAVDRKGLGQQEVREQLMQTAIQIAPQEVVPLETRQAFYTFARSEMEKQIARQPEDARLRVFLGSFLRIFGNTKEAVDELAKAQEFSPHKQTILFELAFAHMADGDIPGALEITKQAYESEPRFDTARVVYATVLIYSNKSDEAQKLLNERYGEDAVVDNELLLQAYFDSKQFDRVLAVWQERAVKNPKDANVLVSLGSAYLNVRDTQKAIEVLQKAKELNPALANDIDQYIEQIRTGQVGAQ